MLTPVGALVMVGLAVGGITGLAVGDCTGSGVGDVMGGRVGARRSTV